MQKKNFARRETRGCESPRRSNLGHVVMCQWEALRMPKCLMLALGMVLTIATAFAAAPVLTPPSNTTIIEDSGRANIPFTVTDADTPFFSITVTARSSNTNLVPLANLFIVGSGTTRDLG